MPLPPTKLVVPGVRSRAVQRSDLPEHLDAAVRLPMTLISAPAGFGRTTLLAQWIGGLRAARCGWVSLDAGDRDVARFWRYVVAKLHGAWPRLKTDAWAGSGASRPLSTSAVPAQLIIDLAQLDEVLVLVLDDYHLAENEALDAGLAFLIERMPPRLHLVLGTRNGPSANTVQAARPRRAARAPGC